VGTKERTNTESRWSLITVVVHSDGYVEVWGDEDSSKVRMVLLRPGDKLSKSIKGKLLGTGVPQTERRSRSLSRMEAARIATKQHIVPGGLLEGLLKAIGESPQDAVAGIKERSQRDEETWKRLADG